MPPRALRPRSPIASGVLLATAAAVSFGMTMPLIATFGGGVGPLSTAALLYSGAAALSIVLHPLSARSGRSLTRAALPRLGMMALCGAVLAPTLLVWGLKRAGPTGSSLMLNFEAAFTVFFAWLAYREPLGRRVVGAATAMLVGGAFIGVDARHANASAHWLGLAAVLLATACWGIDNTLSLGLAEEDPLDVVAAKGALGAVTTGALAVAFGEPKPASASVLMLLLCGATGYGLSLRLYLLAQRRMGAARTGSVFAAGPFVGAALAFLIGDRTAGWATVAGAMCFGAGMVLHVTERHSHAHTHASLEHEHAHRHDDGHHGHRHDPPVQGEHTHRHQHARLDHAHEHAPDIHHEHPHP